MVHGMKNFQKPSQLQIMLSQKICLSDIIHQAYNETDRISLSFNISYYEKSERETKLWRKFMHLNYIRLNPIHIYFFLVNLGTWPLVRVNSPQTEIKYSDFE